MIRFDTRRDKAGWWRKRARWCNRAWHRLRQPFLLHRVRHVVVEHVDDTPLVVMPGVFNPVLFRTGEFLARTISRFPAADSGAASSQPTALDMGTGSGISAIFAARSGHRVIGVDMNADAVRCARINVLLSRLEDQIEIRQGDLFDVVHGGRFDLVLFNPPFFVGQPRNAADMAWRSPDVMERFAMGLPHVLKPTGRALVLLSTDGAPQRMLRALHDQQYAVEEVASQDFGNEVLTVYCVRRECVEHDGAGGRNAAQSNSG